MHAKKRYASINNDTKWSKKWFQPNQANQSHSKHIWRGPIYQIKIIWKYGWDMKGEERGLKMDQKQCTKSYKNKAKIMPKNYNKSREACQGIRADELVKKVSYCTLCYWNRE